MRVVILEDALSELDFVVDECYKGCDSNAMRGLVFNIVNGFKEWLKDESVDMAIIDEKTGELL